MTLEEFKQDYLRHYCLLEKDFVNTIDYVSLSPQNYATFSPVYLKILLSIGSEVDVIEDLICELLNTDKKNFSKAEPDFFSVIVEVKSYNIVLTPWKPNYPPTWWTVYNEVKHNRNKTAEKLSTSRRYFEYDNLENVLSALAGLFSLVLLAYRIIANNNNESLFVPAIHTIFQIKNVYWTDIHWGNGFILCGSELNLFDSV